MTANSYWMTSSKQKDTGNWKRKHWTALSGEFASDLSYDRLQCGGGDDNDDDDDEEEEEEEDTNEKRIKL